MLEPGTVVRQTVDNTDWYPMLLAMAGLSVPEGITVRGRSFLPLLKGRSASDWDDGFNGEYSVHHRMRMFRDAGKLHRNVELVATDSR